MAISFCFPTPAAAMEPKKLPQHQCRRGPGHRELASQTPTLILVGDGDAECKPEHQKDILDRTICVVRRESALSRIQFVNSVFRTHFVAE
jgi:hypothetical protein